MSESDGAVDAAVDTSVAHTLPTDNIQASLDESFEEWSKAEQNQRNKTEESRSGDHPSGDGVGAIPAGGADLPAKYRYRRKRGIIG